MKPSPINLINSKERVVMSNVNPCVQEILKQLDLTPDFTGLRDLMVAPRNIIKRSIPKYRQEIYIKDQMGFAKSKAHLNLFEYIYHLILEKKEKKNIYKSVFEIGNPDPITHKSSFHPYLQMTYGGADTYEVVAFIKKQIELLTGIEFRKFIDADESLAYKVITLFYRLIKNNHPRLFSFIEGGAKDSVNFEFRSTYPMAHEQAINNTAILAELLGSLTFQMPREYLEVCWTMQAEIFTTVENLASQVRSSTRKDQGIFESKKIGEALNQIMPLTDKAVMDRLDFKLFAALTLREYEIRTRSNALVNKAICSNPLNFNSIRDFDYIGHSEESTLKYMLGLDEVPNKNRLDIKSDFYMQIVMGYRYMSSKPLLPIHRTIMKALIIHDDKLKIEIPSVVQGTGNIPKSITSIFTKAATYQAKNGKLPDWSTYPEGLTCYWDLRFKFARNALVAPDMGEYIKLHLAFIRNESIVDEHVIAYLYKQNLSGFEYFTSTIPKALDNDFRKLV